ncbi:MAG: PTS sugar transporter subunit IIB [Clostridiaceae bacterium]
MKILLVCAAGMSTSLLVQKMKKEVKPEDGEVIIKAEPMELFEEVFMEYDVVLLAPQISFKKKPFTQLASEQNVPVGTISSLEYGRLMAKEILHKAYNLANKTNEIS